MARNTIHYRGQRWDKTKANGWLTLINVESSRALSILEAFDEGEADQVMAGLFAVGVIYTGEVISITSCKNPTGGCIRLAVYVSVVK